MPTTPTNAVLPVVSGTTRAGSTLTATSGTWTGGPTFVYQWQRATASTGTYSNIGSAVNNTYVLTDSDIGKYIKVSVVATNGAGSASVLSDATAVVVDLPDSVVPTATSPVATATGFTFTISNYSNSYTYALTTTNGSATRSLGDVTVSGLTAGESATVTIAVTRTNYKSASKAVTGSAIPAPTTTTTTKAARAATVSTTTSPPTTTTTAAVVVNDTTTSRAPYVRTNSWEPHTSTTTAAGACTGLGIAPNTIGEVFGIFKAYATRVGSGPFPTELFDEAGETMGRVGMEFGATTGRSRRCGWIDLPALKYAILLNGVSEMVMTKADVLSGFDTIYACTHYQYNGEKIDYMPYDINALTATPVLEAIPGWNEDLTGIRAENEIPSRLKNYIAYLEKHLEVPVRYLSVGPDREQTLILS